MLLKLAHYLKDPYGEPTVKRLYELRQLRDDSASDYGSILSRFGHEKVSDPYLDVYSFRSEYYRFMQSHKPSLEIREKNPRPFRAKTTELDSRAKINGIDALLCIKKNEPIFLDELVEHIVKVHAHTDNLIPIGISTLDYEILQTASERVRQISLTVIFNAYMQVYEFDNSCIANEPVRALFVHQDLRILTYVGALLSDGMDLMPRLTDFELKEKKVYEEKIKPVVQNLFDLTF